MGKALLIVGVAALGFFLYRQGREARPIRPTQRIALPAGVRGRKRAGVVTLTGRASAAERDRLLAAILAHPGVVRVVNLIEVEASDERVGSGATSSHAPLA